MAHNNVISDDDRYFRISESGDIEYLGEGEPTLTVDSHNSERYTFELPRYIEGHDMLECNSVTVHFINISSDNSSMRSLDIYKVKDLAVADDDNSVLLCSWLLSRKTTMYAGVLSFALRFECKSGSQVEYVWPTRTYSKINVFGTTNNSDVVVEQYTDILEEWYMELVMAGTVGINEINAAKEDVVGAIGKALDEIESVKKEAIEQLKTYDGGTEAVLKNIPFYNGETEEVV